jgi:hypothetical protein
MTDYNKLFSNLRTKLTNVNDLNYSSLKMDVDNYFSQINVDYNFKNSNKEPYQSWIDSMEDKNRKIHIYYYNKLEEIKKLGNLYLNFKNHSSANNVMKNFVNSKVSELKKENNKNKNTDNINKRLSKYYNESIEDVKYYKNIAKSIFNLLLISIFVLFLVKKQYKNLKILFYILLLFLFPYIISPCWETVLSYTHGYSRVFHLYYSYYMLAFMFSLFVSFKYFVFNEGSPMEGRRDLYILGFIILFGLGSLFVNFLFYNKGVKTLFA